MTEQLRECPLCGADRANIVSVDGFSRVVCQACQCGAPQHWNTLEEAVRAWNTRPGERHGLYSDASNVRWVSNEYAKRSRCRAGVKRARMTPDWKQMFILDPAASCRAMIAALRERDAEIARLRGTLEKFGGHHALCGKQDDGSWHPECNCGLADALASSGITPAQSLPAAISSLRRET